METLLLKYTLYAGDKGNEHYLVDIESVKCRLNRKDL